MWDKIKKFFKSESKKIINRLNLDSHKKINENLKLNLNYIKDNLAASSDLVFREFYIGADKNLAAQLIFFDALVKDELLQGKVLKPLMLEITGNLEQTEIKEQVNDTLTELSIPISGADIITSLEQVITEILGGKAILLVDQVDKAFSLDVRDWQGREIDKPGIEASTRGPQEAFNESLQTNIALIRKRLQDNNLMIEIDNIGKRTNTELAITYIEDLAEPELIDRIKYRLDNIDVDGILEIGQINQYLSDNWLTIFPLFQTTERPDRVVGNLLEGRVVLMIDGSPFASIMPTTFVQFYQSPEDYYDQFYIGTALRILRFAAAFLTISLPAIYISLVSFRHELIPHELAISLAEVREGVPFPSYLEALIMEISLELLREAGIRLPGPIGETIGIVGGLILGDAAVAAGLVSPPMVIIVALTAIVSFLIPNYEAAVPLRLLRFPMMFLAASFSTYGIMIGWLLILIHLCSLESFGQPYFAPFAPLKWSDLKDTIIRAPIRLLSKRPLSVPNQQQDRQDRKGEDPNEME
ncbi:spore germination protein [Natroniella acetigena]|uniref:spore germination protein n=1 Tax=Natroniella acetigena TaxID=52004 RepID=UPI00200B8E75|nr:spore germination protein [Natroniella acetigena]MCK8828294.1 spore germination protein [Natroniella acetigena]